MDSSEMCPYERSPLNVAIESADDILFERLIMEENCPLDVTDAKGWRPLQVAAFNGCLSIVQRLLQHDQEIAIDYRNFDGETALWLATMTVHLQPGLQVCKCLLQNGAQPNISNNENESPLHIAVRNRLLDCARLLLEFGAKVNAVDSDGDSPIVVAVDLGFPDIVALLIESGADMYTSNDSGCSLLFVAAQKGCLQCLRLIHEKRCYGGNADVDFEVRSDKTPLIIAAQCGNLDCVQYLLNKGANANKATSLGALAIHLATLQGHLGCVKALLPHTSQYALLMACYGNTVTEDPDWLLAFLDRVRANSVLTRLYVPNGGHSLLHIAIEWDRLEILEYFLESGIHPDRYMTLLRSQILSATAYGYDVLFQTALGLACSMGSEPMVTVLLDHGARFTPGNDLVCNPLHFALTANCPSGFIRLLVERGADINCHMMDDNDVPLSMCYAFEHPHLLHECLVQGYRFKYWDHEVLGGVGRLLVDMARHLQYTDDLLNALLVLVHFAPRHQFAPLYSTLKSICEDDANRSCVGWAKLDRELASPQSLKALCRFKTREVIMLRSGFRLESDVSTLDLPQILLGYLMFR